MISDRLKQIILRQLKRDDFRISAKTMALQLPG